MGTPDEILYSACPIHPAPTFAGFQPLTAPGKRLIAARDGLYLEAFSPAMHVLQPVAAVPTPYGEVTPFIRLHNGRIPRQLLHQVASESLSASPSEVAFIIHREAGGYSLHTPTTISASAGHISYHDTRDSDQLVVDIHSHGAAGAFFSSRDDASDLSRQGPYIAGVIAPRTDPKDTRVIFRLVCPPYLIPLPANAIKELFA